MKLSWGKRFWPDQSASDDPLPRLIDDVTCEVLIVGAGISGSLVADALVRAGVDVVAIDKRSPGCGSTGASTSLLLYELDTPLRKLIGMIGEERAARAYRLGVETIDKIEHLVAELGDSCGFERKRSVYLASSETDAIDLRAEYALRKKHGLRVRLLEAGDIAERFTFSRPAAIVSADAAQADPYRLNQRVLGRAIQNGARLFTDTELARYEATENGIRAVTRDGRQIRANRIVYATGYEAAGMIGPDLAHAQVSYAVASQPLASFAGWWEQCLLWETATPYLYLRTTADGRAIIGGEDDENLRHLNDRARLRQKTRRLQSRFGEMFPHISFQPAAAWAGVFDTTPDGLAYIGTHKKFPHALFALGYGGNGMTFSMIAAEILRDQILGRRNSDADIFSFDRGRGRAKAIGRD